jgi:hypothetical protein
MPASARQRRPVTARPGTSSPAGDTHRLERNAFVRAWEAEGAPAAANGCHMCGLMVTAVQGGRYIRREVLAMDVRRGAAAYLRQASEPVDIGCEDGHLLCQAHVADGAADMVDLYAVRGACCPCHVQWSKGAQHGWRCALCPDGKRTTVRDWMVQTVVAAPSGGMRLEARCVDHVDWRGEANRREFEEAVAAVTWPPLRGNVKVLADG